jgi:hypothetical protein
MASKTVEFPLAWRKDGWPLCPKCGEDELFSQQHPARPTDALACYRCDWQGYIPARGEGKTVWRGKARG